MPCKLKIEIKHHTRKQVLKDLMRTCVKLGITKDDFIYFCDRYTSLGRVDCEFGGDAADWNIETFFALAPVKLIESELYDYQIEDYEFGQYPKNFAHNYGFKPEELSDDIKFHDGLLDWIEPNIDKNKEIK